MDPVLKAGSFALFRRQRQYAAGDVVLADHERFGRIVKRAVDTNEGKLWLEGANANSLSRETIGPVDSSDILGKLVWQVERPSK